MRTGEWNHVPIIVVNILPPVKLDSKANLVQNRRVQERLDLQQYKKRLLRIWLIGIFGLGILFGVVKWKAHQEGTATNSIPIDAAQTLGLALGLPTLVVGRGYFRYKRWLHEQLNKQG
jgi:hypothetical protein